MNEKKFKFVFNGVLYNECHYHEGAVVFIGCIMMHSVLMRCSDPEGLLERFTEATMLTATGDGGVLQAYNGGEELKVCTDMVVDLKLMQLKY